ncbi:unnamed protein product [Closterium sp. NIES-64]|nr:unnamed protein product [Closterium sp. NIES-64]
MAKDGVDVERLSREREREIEREREREREERERERKRERERWCGQHHRDESPFQDERARRNPCIEDAPAGPS